MTFKHDRALGNTGRAALGLALASALAAGLAGCAGPADTDPLEDLGQPQEDVPVSGEPAGASAPPSPPPPAIAEACPEGERLGKRLGATCPAPDDGSGWEKYDLGVSALSSYCGYRWIGGAKVAPDTAKLPVESGRAGSAWTQADCMAVTPMAPSDDAEDAVKSSLRQAFWTAVERPSSLPVPAAGGATVRVAVIDTWPGVATVGRSQHGLGMAGVIEDLTCDRLAGACPIHIVPHLALDMVSPGVFDEQNGGYFARQGHLAAEIVSAVDSWQSEEPGSKLIINLSVGWDPMYQATAPGAARASALAVKEALEYATCAGALVIAAAGNTSFGPTPTPGLIYPAAWVTEHASCAAQPRLVWAVGGLSAKDRPVYNARPGGMPELAAPAELAYGTIHVPGTGNVPGGPFTGTSVAAAVATAAASAVWMYDGGKTRFQVMRLLQDSGEPLSWLTPDVCTGVCEPVARISVCRAAAAAGAAVTCDPVAAGQGSSAAWTPGELAAVESLAVLDFTGPPLISPQFTAPCTVPVFRSAMAAGAGVNPCPLEQYASAVERPTTGPQPGSDPCGSCALAVASPSDATLEIAVSSELIGTVAKVYPQVLTVYSTYGTPARYDVGGLTYTDKSGVRHVVRDEGLDPGQVYKLQLTGLSGSSLLPAGIETSILEWVNIPDLQTSSRVVVFTR